MSIIFIVHFDEFYTALFRHTTMHIELLLKKNMTKKSAESYGSLKGNDKAISIFKML